MIVRVYRASVRKGKESEWDRIIRDVALPLVKRQKGIRSCRYGWTVGSGAKEFFFVSEWDSLEDVKRFAGKDWEQPVIPEEEKPMLESGRCDHFEGAA